MRVLVLVSDRPTPPISGPRVRNAHLWPALRRLGVEVTLVGLDQSGSGAPHDDVELLPFDRPARGVRVWQALRHSYHEWPRSSALAARAAELARDWRPDVVHAEELRMSAYLPPRAGGAPPLHSMTLHNVESDLQRVTGSSPIRVGAGLIDRVHARSLARFERRALERSDVAFAYSARDRERYRTLYPDLDARLRATRNGADVAGVMPAPQPAQPGVLLVGSLYYPPNVRGLFWFLDEVLPRLPAALPVTVAGSHATADVRARLAASRVRFVDTPPDLAPLYAAHAISAVPLFQGSGTRTKILEALAHERLVVTTRIGAEGLELAEGEGWVLAEDAATFAEQILRYAGDGAARAAIARRGREAVRSRYDWGVVAAELLDAWRALTASA
jgi:glycosyltransferase involved in cell wall biosynthesis